MGSIFPFEDRKTLEYSLNSCCQKNLGCTLWFLCLGRSIVTEEPQKCLMDVRMLDCDFFLSLTIFGIRRFDFKFINKLSGWI